MNLKCMIGIHKWGELNKCRCIECGKIRDGFHVWTRDCEKCWGCDKTRQNAHSWDGCKCTKCSKTRDEGHTMAGCVCKKCGIKLHQLDGCKCKKCDSEVHDIYKCTCRRCGKTFHDWEDNGLPNDACRICGLSGSDRNKTVACSKCGGSTTLFLTSNGKLILALSEREVRLQAYWCDHCQLILCASCCVDFPSTPEGLLMIKSKCPTCGGEPSQATEEHFKLSTDITKKKANGLIRYVLLVASLPEQPSAGQMSAFLMDILPEFQTQHDGTGKVGLLWETKPINSINMSSLAVNTFGNDIMDEKKYTYRTLQHVLSGGEAKCLVVYDIDAK